MTFPVNGNLYQHFTYFLKGDISKLYMTIAIRNLAMGMVGIFTPVYIFLYYHNSFALTALYFGLMFGLYGMFAVFGGRLLGRFGAEKCMFASSFFFIAHFLSLFFIETSSLLVPASLLTAALGLTLFWPAFHTEFARFSSQERRGSEAGRVNVAMIMPTILAPALGGVLLMFFGFPVLFIAASLLLLASVIPLFYAADHHEVYTDSFKAAWGRIFRKENRAVSTSLLSEGLEIGVSGYVWPVFLFLVAPQFSEMGFITSIALVGSSLFMLYAGRVSDTQRRTGLLNIGAIWTSLAWVLRYFIATPFSALLTNTNYEIARAASSVPYRTLFYERAALLREEADEFIIYFEVVSNMGRFFFFSGLAAIFWLFPLLPLQTTFFLGALFSLGLMLLGNPPKLRLPHAQKYENPAKRRQRDF